VQELRETPRAVTPFGGLTRLYQLQAIFGVFALIFIVKPCVFIFAL
jgi:hypothetical protein